MRMYTVDAFTKEPFAGNPAAVCLLDEERDARFMQKVAREMNLAETAFLLKQGDVYQLRWFTPEAEVDLCGHATLASAHVLWEIGETKVKTIKFSSKSGILTASRADAGAITLDFPAEPIEACPVPQGLLEALGVRTSFVGRNRLDYMVEVESEAIVQSLKPDFRMLSEIGGARGVIVTSRSNRDGIDFVSRCFFPGIGVPEDPVTGSAHCGLAPYWQDKLGRSELTAMQISARTGKLLLKVNGERVLLTGHAVTVLKGNLVV